MHPWLIAPLLLLFTQPVHADGEILKLITPSDQTRLNQYDDTRAQALAEARADGAKDEVTALETSLQQPHLSFANFDMIGNWQCRTIKVGGLLPLVIYDWFACRVTDDGSGWTLEKLTGSQRTEGRFFTDSDSRLIYLGSYFVAGDKPPLYGSGLDTDQVGYAYRTGDETWWIEFPRPVRESVLDIIEFRRD